MRRGRVRWLQKADGEIGFRLPGVDLLRRCNGPATKPRAPATRPVPARDCQPGSQAPPRQLLVKHRGQGHQRQIIQLPANQGRPIAGLGRNIQKSMSRAAGDLRTIGYSERLPVLPGEPRHADQEAASHSRIVARIIGATNPQPRLSATART